MKYLFTLALLVLAVSMQAQVLLADANDVNYAPTQLTYEPINTVEVAQEVEEVIVMLEDSRTIRYENATWEYGYDINRNRWYVTLNNRHTTYARSFRGIVRRIAKDMDIWSFRHTRTAKVFNTLFPQFKAVGF